MDSLLPSSSVPKRPCPGDLPASSSLARVFSSPASMDRLLEALLALGPPSISLDLSLERLVDSRPLDLEKERLIDGAMRVGSALLEAAKRCARKRASAHNFAAWPLPADLTVRVLSMLDTRSLCHAAATCSMFNKCATDPLCYANIDLTTVVPTISNAVVSTLIQRAGKHLQSLKLGILPGLTSNSEPSRSASLSTRNLTDTSVPSSNDKRHGQWRKSSALTRSCLLALSLDNGAPGSLLRKLCLYNIDKMDHAALGSALSVCQSLTALEVIGLCIELKQSLMAVSVYCHSLEHLFIESSEIGRDDSLKSSTCLALVAGCPRLMSLSLRGFKLQDHKVHVLVKGFHNLKYADFSTSLSVTGTFLRNLGNGTNAEALESLILCDCLQLKEIEVSLFLSALLGGDWKQLRRVDISNKDGLSADDDWNYRCYNPCTLQISQLSGARPEICLVAEFPPEGSFADTENISGSETSSDVSLLSFAGFGPYGVSLYNSSYLSDHGSGNEELNEANFSLEADGFDDLPLI